MTFDQSKSEFVTQSFKGLKLKSIELIDKEFDACTFDDCDFSDAILTECKFIDCEFKHCNLSLVALSKSRFTDVTFEQCKMIAIDWTQVIWPSLQLSSSISFYECILNDSSFFGLNLEQLTIVSCKAHDVDFRDGDFAESNFKNTDFLSSLFGKTNLKGCDFTDATNYYIDLNDNEIKGATLSRFEAVNLLEQLGIVLVD